MPKIATNVIPFPRALDLSEQTVVVEVRLHGDFATMFSSMLMELNAGKTPAMDGFFTPSALAESILEQVLVEDALAHAGDPGRTSN